MVVLVQRFPDSAWGRVHGSAGVAP